MGRKFVSIHILDSSIDEVCWSLVNCRMDLKNNEAYMENILKKLNKSSKIIDSKLSIKAKEAEFYLAEANGNISVFSEYFYTQVIKEQVKRWFAGSNRCVLVVDYFDDDYLEMSIFRKYKFLTSLICGNNLQLYGLTNTKFDSEKVCNIFDIQAIQLEQAYNLDDIVRLAVILRIY
ncbi:hypothetical protein [Candidatus Clostridium radicumherbarum]|uniref:Uncharacterized protein n=1 Tax=Candidatus Clostridium radicumherbarum TaxID=3381662 RepID=A0ABW8TVR0_9CLOT